MMRFTKKVYGLDINPEKILIAKNRGLNVYVSDYRVEPIPEADVYYFWPSNVERDTPFLIWKILRDKKFNGTIITGADSNLFREKYISYIISIFGILRKINFNEGIKYRQSGVFLLTIIEKNLGFQKIFLIIISYLLRMIFYIKVRIKRIPNKYR